MFPNSFAFQEQPDRNNFGPRFGFAYTPHLLPWLMGHDKTVIRGGYGIFYDGLFTNILDNTAATAPNTFGGDANGDGRERSARTRESLGPALLPSRP